MKLRLPLLNGWMRLYIVVVAVWIAALSYWFSTILPSRPDDFSLEIQANLQLSNELDHIRRISDPADRYRSADRFCEIAYLKASDQSSPINKNECLEFMLNPNSTSPTAQAVTEVRLTSPLKMDKIRDLRKANDVQFWSAMKDLLPSFVVQLIGGPLALLACGVVVAWVRRGFKVDTLT